MQSILDQDMGGTAVDDPNPSHYETPWTGCSRTKLNCFLNVERDDVITGLTTTYLAGYTGSGQLAAWQGSGPRASSGSMQAASSASSFLPPPHRKSRWRLRNSKFGALRAGALPAEKHVFRP